MKRLSGYLSALVLSGALLTACSDDGGTNYEALAQAFEDCSQESAASLVNVLYALASVPDAIESEDDEPIPGFHVVSLTELPPPAAPNTWSFAVTFDTNGNGIPDTTVSGTAVFSETPVDGLDPGATIQVTFAVEDSALAGAPIDTGTFTGSGNIVLTLGALTNEASVVGTATFTDGSCVADLTFDALNPLNLRFNDLKKPVQLAASLGLVEIFGQILAFLETQGHDFDGDLDIEEEGNTVFVTGLIDDTVEVDTDFELVPPEEAFDALFGCAFTTLDWLEFFARVFNDLGTVSEGGIVTGVSVTPAGPNVFNYSVNLALYDPAIFTAGTIAGRATLIFPVISGIEPSEVTVTWTVTNATFPSGDVTNGQSTSGRLLRFIFAGGEPVAFSGAGSFSTVVGTPPIAGITPSMDCDVTFDIPETDPVDLLVDTSGTILLTVTIEGYFMTFVLDLETQQALITVNGIPFPFFFF